MQSKRWHLLSLSHVRHLISWASRPLLPLLAALRTPAERNTLLATCPPCAATRLMSWGGRPLSPTTRCRCCARWVAVGLVETALQARALALCCSRGLLLTLPPCVSISRCPLCVSSLQHAAPPACSTRHPHRRPSPCAASPSTLTLTPSFGRLGRPGATWRPTTGTIGSFPVLGAWRNIGGTAEQHCEPRCPDGMFCASACSNAAWFRCCLDLQRGSPGAWRHRPQPAIRVAAGGWPGALHAARRRRAGQRWVL